MVPAARRQAILNFLAERGFASAAELCQMFSVSEMTIRRDLAELDKQGLLKRIYGGATVTESAFFELSYKAKVTQFVAEKKRIGQAAAGLVQPDEVILLDSGSTTTEVARHLKDKHLTVVTNALNIASELLDSPHIEIHLAGGLLKKHPLCLVGPQAIDFFKEVRADKLFLGVEGVDVNGGLTVPDVIEAHTKRAMINSARQVIVVAGHNKLGRQTLSPITPLAEANILITGQEAPPEIVAELRQHIEVITA